MYKILDLVEGEYVGQIVNGTRFDIEFSSKEEIKKYLHFYICLMSMVGHNKRKYNYEIIEA